MWLFTQHGYYSVVADGTNRDYVLVRARSEQHLANLCARFDLDADLVRTPAADHPFRLRVKRQRWIALAQDMAADVRYTNFETAAAKNGERALPRFVQMLRKVGALVEECMEPLRPRLTKKEMDEIRKEEGYR